MAGDLYGLVSCKVRHSLRRVSSLYTTQQPFSILMMMIISVVQAYKIEPLILGTKRDPVILPHHKGRKRMHKG